MVATIRGVQFEDVDFTELETAGAYEEGLQSFVKMSESLTSTKNIRDQIIKVHDCVADWLDGVLGEGAAEAVFNGKISMNEAGLAAADLMKAYADCINDMKMSMESAMGSADEVLQSVHDAGMNRQQRRAAERNRANAKRHKTAKRVPVNPEEAEQ